jgi:hypothetical protein
MPILRPRLSLRCPGKRRYTYTYHHTHNPANFGVSFRARILADRPKVAYPEKDTRLCGVSALFCHVISALALPGSPLHM